jgi:hypothetical protein
MSARRRRRRRNPLLSWSRGDKIVIALIGMAAFTMIAAKNAMLRSSSQ